MLKATSAPTIWPSHFEPEYLTKYEDLLVQWISAQLHLRNVNGNSIGDCFELNPIHFEVSELPILRRQGSVTSVTSVTVPMTTALRYLQILLLIKHNTDLNY